MKIDKAVEIFVSIIVAFFAVFGLISFASLAATGHLISKTEEPKISKTEEPKLVLIEPEGKVADSMCDGFGGLNYVVSRSSRVSVARHIITISAECKDGSEITRIVSVK